MTTDPESSTDPPETGHRDDTDSIELVAEIERLRAENRRLRHEYVRARQARYRRAAVGLIGVGITAALGGVIFPDSQRVLFVLGGIGVFAGVLTYYLTPERFIPARIGELVYETFAANIETGATELGLQDDRVYVPVTDDPGSSENDFRLFIPLHTAYELPTHAELEAFYVTAADEDRRGIALAPIGSRLFQEFEDARTTPLSDEPATLTDQLTDAVVEQFELASSAIPDVDPHGGRVTVGITNAMFGPLDQIDHPIPSFLAVGLAAGLQLPIHTDTTHQPTDRYDSLITLTWTPPDPDAESTTPRTDTT